MNIFDSHAHYNDERFSEEFSGGAKEALNASFASGVIAVLNAGTNAETSRECIALAHEFPNLYASAGLHPSDIRHFDDPFAELAAIEPLLDDEKVVALGEIGLDYHYEETNKPLQQEIFARQLELAVKKDLPVIIHDREAHGDTMDILRKNPACRGILHSYSGSCEMAKELLKMDFVISFSGVITFKNAARMRDVVASVPLDRMLVETDCPYLAPHPHRGEINYSAYLPYTIGTIAEIKGVDPQTVAEITTENAKRVFGLSF